MTPSMRSRELGAAARCCAPWPGRWASCSACREPRRRSPSNASSRGAAALDSAGRRRSAVLAPSATTASAGAGSAGSISAAGSGASTVATASVPASSPTRTTVVRAGRSATRSTAGMASVAARRGSPTAAATASIWTAIPTIAEPAASSARRAITRAGAAAATRDSTSATGSASTSSAIPATAARVVTPVRQTELRGRAVLPKLRTAVRNRRRLLRQRAVHQWHLPLPVERRSAAPVWRTRPACRGSSASHGRRMARGAARATSPAPLLALAYQTAEKSAASVGLQAAGATAVPSPRKRPR
jgi:hypothetical protein